MTIRIGTTVVAGGGSAHSIKNQNRNESATNPIYDWVGTYEEYTTQQVASLHPNWVCYITDDTDDSDFNIATTNNLFDFKWSDHILDDIRWIRADTFSWHAGGLYNAAYQHLLNDIETSTNATETIAGITVNYKLAEDGHKILLGTEGAIVAQQVYDATGISWYYVLDTDYQQFKLPRTQYGFTGIRDEVGKYIPQDVKLPNITTDTDLYYDVYGWGRIGVRGGGNQSTDALYRSNSQLMTLHMQNIGQYNVIQATDPDPDTTTIGFDASRSSSVYSGDGTDTLIQTPSTEMYLYFYIGQFVIDPEENIEDLVHKSGDETINGNKTFNSNAYIAFPENALFDETAASRYLTFKDSNNKGTGWIESRINSEHSSTVSGVTTTRLWARTWKDDTYETTVNSTIDIVAKPDGTVYATAPTPKIYDNHSEIVNTDWINQNRTCCITANARNINLTLSDGTLTLHAGSKVYVPNGFEEDGTTLKFDTIEIEDDITFAIQTGGGWQDKLVVYYKTDGNLQYRFLRETFSGSTTPTTYLNSVWYNTTDNVIKDTRDNGTTWSDYNISLPIAICSGIESSTAGTGIFTNIDQVLNNYSYIGSYIFALPGVSGLWPNGRNTDSSLWNVAVTTTKVSRSKIFDNCEYGINKSGVINEIYNHLWIEQDETPNAQYAGIWYNTKENILYKCTAGSNPIKISLFKFCKLFTENSNETEDESRVSQSIEYKPFIATDRNEILDLKNHNISYNNVTNCVTKIPQDIRLEINSDGQAVVKKGSIIYIPRGKLADSSDYYERYILPNNITSVSAALTNGTKCLLYITSKNTIYAKPITSFTVSDTDPATSNNTLWYDTTANVIKWKDDQGNWNSSLRCLPLAMCTVSSNKITMVNQVFNGIGYIGHVAYTLPGLTVLIPYGRNEDGSLRNIEHTTTRVLRTFLTEHSINPQAISLQIGGGSETGTSINLDWLASNNTTVMYTQPFCPNTSTYKWLNTLENKTYWYSEDQGMSKPSFKYAAQIATYKNNSTGAYIDTLIPNTVVSTGDVNRYAEHRVILYQEPNSTNNYTWYRLYSDGWVEQGGHINFTGSGYTATVTFPIVMLNTNYTLSGGELSKSDGYGYHSHVVVGYDKTTTGFKSKVPDSGQGKDWTVSGIAASYGA